MVIIKAKLSYHYSITRDVKYFNAIQFCNNFHPIKI